MHYYDDCFNVEKSKWGTYRSYNKDGKMLVISSTEEGCVSATRFYLKGVQEGFVDTITHEGVIGGKL